MRFFLSISRDISEEYLFQDRRYDILLVDGVCDLLQDVNMRWRPVLMSCTREADRSRPELNLVR